MPRRTVPGTSIREIAKAMHRDRRISAEERQRIVKSLGPTVKPLALAFRTRMALGPQRAEEFRQYLGEELNAHVPVPSLRMRRTTDEKKTREILEGESNSWRYSPLANAITEMREGEDAARKVVEIEKRAVDAQSHFSREDLANKLKTLTPEAGREYIDALHAYTGKGQLESKLAPHAVRLGPHTVEHFQRVTGMNEENRAPLGELLWHAQSPAHARELAHGISRFNTADPSFLAFARNSARENREHVGSALTFLADYERARNKTEFLLEHHEKARALFGNDRWNMQGVAHLFRAPGAPRIFTEKELADPGHAFGSSENIFREMRERLEKIKFHAIERARVPKGEREEFDELGKRTFSATGARLTLDRFRALQTLKPLFEGAADVVEQKIRADPLNDSAWKRERMEMDFNRDVAIPLLEASPDTQALKANVRAFEQFMRSEREHPALVLGSLRMHGDERNGLKNEYYNRGREIRHMLALQYYRNAGEHVHSSIPARWGGTFYENDHPKRDFVAQLSHSPDIYRTARVIAQGGRRIVDTHARYQRILEAALKKVGEVRTKQEFTDKMGAALPKKLNERERRLLEEMIADVAIEVEEHG